MITTKPRDVGLSAERLRRIGPVMQAWIDGGKIPGLSVLLARRGKIAYAECFGKRDDPDVPMTQDTIFWIASMIKPIVSVAVLMLYEEGHFQLNDPVSRYIPEFKDTKVYVKGAGDRMVLAEQERQMSIRHLLTHTSGLHYPWAIAPALLPLLEEANLFDPERTTQDFVKELAKLPLSFQPGTSWAYGQSHDVLGYLVEVISGMPLDAFLEQKILRPLGMPDTGFYVPSDKIGLSAFTSMPRYYWKGHGYGLGVRTLLSPAENELVGSVGSYGWSGIHNTYFWVDPQEELFGFIWGQFSPIFFYPVDRQFMVLAYQALVD